MERAFGDAYDDFRNKVTKEVDETVEIIMESYHIVEAQFIKEMYLRGAYDLFCRGQTLDKAMPFHLASLILQSQTKCLTILYFLSFYTFDTFCFGWHFCNTFVITPNEFICFLY